MDCKRCGSPLEPCTECGAPSQCADGDRCTEHAYDFSDVTFELPRKVVARYRATRVGD